MIHITGKIPRRVAVAVSGGIDSMAALDFLRRAHDVVVLHYNHGTPYAPKAEALVRGYCIEHKLTIVIGRCEEEMPDGVSLKRGGEKSATSSSQKQQISQSSRHTTLTIKLRTGSSQA